MSFSLTRLLSPVAPFRYSLLFKVSAYNSWRYQYLDGIVNLIHVLLHFFIIFLQMMTKVKAQGLVSDLMPNIKLMQVAGHFLFNYHSGKEFWDQHFIW